MAQFLMLRSWDRKEMGPSKVIKISFGQTVYLAKGANWNARRIGDRPVSITAVGRDRPDVASESVKQKKCVSLTLARKTA